MTMPLRISRVVNQALEQWVLVDEWLGTMGSAASTGVRGRLIFAACWLAAICWRLGIGLAMIASFIIDGVTLLLGLVVDLFDALFGWPLAIVCAPVELLFSVPYLGRFLGWLWRIALSLVWGLLHLFEFPLVFLSVMPERKLRLWVVASPEHLDTQIGLDRCLQSIEVAARILQREANIRLVPVTPFQAPDQTYESRVFFNEYRWIRRGMVEMGGQQFAVDCNLEALVEDLGPLGGQLERLALIGHPRGSYRRVSGWGAPLMAVAVQSVAAGELAGCSLGPLTDYVTIRHDQPICLAHEVGHACNLPHSSSPENLMSPTCGGAHLERWQVFLLRLSRHVTYL